VIWTENSIRSYVPVSTIPEGKHVCAVDEPSYVMTLMGVGGFADEAQCAMQCTRDGGCQGFNLKALFCEIYSYIPSLAFDVPGCEYRQVSAHCKNISMSADILYGEFSEL